MNLNTFLIQFFIKIGKIISKPSTRKATFPNGRINIFISHNRSQSLSPLIICSEKSFLNSSLYIYIYHLVKLWIKTSLNCTINGRINKG